MVNKEIRFNAPVTEFKEALPLGNGTIGGMVSGGAIKGHDVDIFLPSLFDTNRFGRNTGCTVYVIREGKG